ncbi:hypothetical protein X975_22474, partial [Stegodyphus mimosarum]
MKNERCPRLDSNYGPLEYASTVLTTTPQRHAKKPGEIPYNLTVRENEDEVVSFLRNHLDDIKHGTMIRKLEERRSVTSVAEEFGIDKSVVSRACETFQTIGTAVRKVSVALPRKITAVDDRDIGLQAKRARNQSAIAIAQQPCIATGQQESQFTVSRRLHKGGLFVHRPEPWIALKAGHRRHRLEWYKEHKNWTSHQLRHSLFANESRFSAARYSQRQLI